MNYVCGFIFDEDFRNVVLVTHPRFGRLNGIGGKGLPDERRARDTMARECKEETTIDVKPDGWVLFAEYVNPMKKRRVLFFFTRLKGLEDVALPPGVELIDVPELINGDYSTVPDVPWLVALARLWKEQELDCVVMMARRGDSGDEWRDKIGEL